ncbi:hypothetical protein [Photobacterium swingsii]|uniref:hypothetical protein n=1 Tax=Photobacterium swingsii TaxID=680026 RepID=UPI004067BAEA
MNINKRKISLKEVSKNEFSMRVQISGFTNSERLDYLNVKYYFITLKDNFIGYVMLAETFNKMTNIRGWVLLNVGVLGKYKGNGVGTIALEKIHSIFLSELGAKSYIVALNSFIMYKMIAREAKKGVVDFYCLINKLYPVEEMKEEEKLLEMTFLQNPNAHADMIVSLDREETERVKPLYFKES